MEPPKIIKEGFPVEATSKLRPRDKRPGVF
jgi:hypothetical protein